MANLKATGKKLMLPLFVSLLLALVFMIYLFTIGIPKTNARNLYNQGIRSLDAGEEEKAKAYFQEAKEAWPEAYILETLEELGEE